MLTKLIDHAIHILRKNEPPEGYMLCFSGGKDSIVCYQLLILSGCKFSAHYNSTTFDQPEVLKYIKNLYPAVIWHYPTWKGKPTNFYKMIIIKGLPSRKIRWCCQIFKEGFGNGRLLIDGIRSKESYNRSKRTKYEYFFNQYYKTKNNKNPLDQAIIDKLYRLKKCKKIIHIIFDWSSSDVWDFIHLNDIEYCSLYDSGYSRIGCIGCPMSSNKSCINDFKRYPIIKANIIKSISIRRSIRNDYPQFINAEDIFNWWISKKTVIAYFAERDQLDIWNNII